VYWCVIISYHARVGLGLRDVTASGGQALDPPENWLLGASSYIRYPDMRASMGIYNVAMVAGDYETFLPLAEHG
jgi:hypothetical protein